MGVTRCYKTAVFLHLYSFFSTINNAWHIYFRFWKRNRCHIGILLPVSILAIYRQLHVILLRPTKFHSNWTTMAELRHHIDFQDGGRGVTNLLPVTSCTWEGQRLSVYQISLRYLYPRLIYFLLPVSRNKRPPSWKSTSTPFWQFLHHRHVALRWHTTFHLNGMIGNRYMTSYLSLRWRPQFGSLLPVSCLVMSCTWEGQIVSVYQISPRCLNPRLRYYYFRFL